MAKTIDARTLTTPIICTLEEIEPVEMSASKDRSQSSVEGLRATATRNQNERTELVKTLVNLASGGRRVRANERRNDSDGR